MPKWPKDTAALVFVHIAAVIAAFGAAWFVHTRSPRMPLYDEWMLLDQYVQSPDLWSWIIAHHNEHRFPLTKAIWIGILRQTGFRFDEPQYLTFGLNVSAGVLALWTARGLRGRSHPLDAILPMLFLHFGHGLNWVMGYQLGFALMAYCTVGWMWAAAAFGRGFRVRWAISSAAYTVPILLCGGFGLGFAPAIVLWWLYLVARFFRLRAPVAALGFGFGAALVIGYSAFNYLTLPPLIGPAISLFDQPLDVLGVAAGFLLVGLGPWPTYENPFSILAPIVGVPVVLAYVFGSLALARRIWRERAADPGRVALALVILGTLILAFATGRSRPTAIIDHYAVVSACGLAALYLSRVRPAEASSSRKSMAIWGAAAALVAGGLYLVNREPGIHGAYRLRDSSHGVAEDIEAREAPIFIMGRHWGNISMMSADRDFGLLRLRDAGIPPFDKLPDDPVFRPQPIGEIPPSVTWRCIEAEYAEQRNLPRLDLPRPPPGTLALRLAADTKRWGGRTKILLQWIDGATGATHSHLAYPLYQPTAVYLVFKIGPGPRAVWLVAGSHIADLELRQFEWLVAPDHR